MWEKIHVQLECGMDWNTINEKKGINVNKLLAYDALQSSATDPWDLDIDRCLVIDDFEAPVTGLMKYIKPDYSYEIGERTVIINHCDGIGMMLPNVSSNNFMVRGPYLKGLLSTFDFLKFCSIHHAEPRIKDVWGKEHNLVQEDIRVLFTKSQLKLWKYYDSWDHYKECFKRCGCHLCRTNYEEEWIADTTVNYQFIQTLIDFSDEELQQFTSHEHQRLKDITKNKEAMLRTLNAEIDAQDPYRQALRLYPELLREAYTRESLKAIKKRRLLDAKSGCIRCQNKRLFAIPDLYAACEYWFLGIKEPQGLLPDGEIACKVYRKRDKADVLRSPHLYMEHAVRKISHDPRIYEWFTTNGVYTSCHDLISRILQFDVDGDMLNVITDPTLITVAERNIRKYHVIPLFYDANKADPETLSKETMFQGLKRAHDYSGIGQISNALTKLWNRNEPDWDAAAWLCYYNNLVIDGAKTGKVNSYEQYPEIKNRINKATGGKTGRMPYFFQFSKNGRRFSETSLRYQKNYSKPNRSTMNRLCNQFNDIGQINLNYAGVAPFNWQMLLPASHTSVSVEAVQLFCQLDDANIANVTAAARVLDLRNYDVALGYNVLKDVIVHELNGLCGDYRLAYSDIVKHLFAGDNLDKSTHKQMFWRVFGDMAVQIIADNLKDCAVCPACRQKIPSWVDRHICPKQMHGFFECVDCGILCNRENARQCRCETCQTKHRRLNKLANKRMHYQRKGR